MPGRVIVRQGNIFDEPSDMIVLPCSTSGTVTDFVAVYLREMNIDYPNVVLKLGDTKIIPFEGGDRIAQYAMLAASVDHYSSNQEAIFSIGMSLGEAANKLSAVRRISAPLLGAGAGRIGSEASVAGLRAGFLKTSPDEATLQISVLHETVFERLRSKKKTFTSKGSKNSRLRVFISHTSQTNEEIEWVKDFALELRSRGFESRLDKFHLRLGMDLYYWMSNEIMMADNVLLICDEHYKQKADGRFGGVGYETMIIEGDMKSLRPDSTKYQLVVRSKKYDDGVPNYLRTRFGLHVDPNNSQKNLVDEISKHILDLPLDPRVDDRFFEL